MVNFQRRGRFGYFLLHPYGLFLTLKEPVRLNIIHLTEVSGVRGIIDNTKPEFSSVVFLGIKRFIKRKRAGLVAEQFILLQFRFCMTRALNIQKCNDNVVSFIFVIFTEPLLIAASRILGGWSVFL